jgi:hypothetical protein
MSENNKRKFMDEELENVAGGGRLGHSNLAAREMKRQEQVEQLAKKSSRTNESKRSHILVSNSH